MINVLFVAYVRVGRPTTRTFSLSVIGVRAGVVEPNHKAAGQAGDAYL
jgi:hypothetical protein